VAGRSPRRPRVARRRGRAVQRLLPPEREPEREPDFEPDFEPERLPLLPDFRLLGMAVLLAWIASSIEANRN
jgi:hypothetical protein